MSTLTRDPDTQPLGSADELSRYFHAFAKACDQMRVGLEAEFFAVHAATGKALPYSGAAGVEAILKQLASKFGYEALLEKGHVIGLKRADSLISLEPGGQIELSAPPVENVFEIDDQLRTFIREIAAIRGIFPEVRFLACGIQPISRLEEIEWVPKRRYEIMAEYMSRHGTQSHHMMKRTATNQVNVDYLSEANAMQNLRTALGITSIVSALFANSSFSEGMLNGYATRRLDIWNHTAPERTGLIAAFTQPGRSFQDYVDYLLEMPLIFIVRAGEWIPVMDRSFRDFIERGFAGHRATLGDFELHLSTAFPEVRLKQYLEIRGVDCQAPDLIPAVAAFWKGILYNCEASKAAWDLVAFAKAEDRAALHRDVPRMGLQAKLAGKPVLPIARELVDLSCRSLARQKRRPSDRDECIFLERIRETITRPGKSPAETLAGKWKSEFRGDVPALLEYLSF